MGFQASTWVLNEADLNNLDGKERAVLLTIAHHVNDKEKPWATFVSQATIGRELGCCERSVHEAMKGLEHDHGLISRKHRSKGAGGRTSDLTTLLVDQSAEAESSKNSSQQDEPPALVHDEPPAFDWEREITKAELGEATEALAWLWFASRYDDDGHGAVRVDNLMRGVRDWESPFIHLDRKSRKPFENLELDLFGAEQAGSLDSRVKALRDKLLNP